MDWLANSSLILQGKGYRMKIKDLIRELGDFDENLDIEVHKVYRTGRIDKFTIEKIVPCIRKENKETVRAIVRIK